jgi:membrane-bound inhibitor of C-type lysozyme
MNKLLFVLLLAATLGTAVSCKPKDVGDPAAAPQSPPPPSDSTAPAAAAGSSASTVAYHCDGLDVTAIYAGDQVTLQTPGREYALPHVQAADGAKYQSDKATFWSKGDVAVIEIDGKPYTNCKEKAAAEAPPGP